MDYLRALLVPFRPTSLLMVGVFSVLLSFCLSAGFYGIFAAVILHIWVLKYCFVIVEHIADGASEPPVMDADMLSPFEVRPWILVALITLGAMLCHFAGDKVGPLLAVVLLFALPAVVALLGMGDNVFQSVNPLRVGRVIRGMGPLYLLPLAVLAGFLAVRWLLMEWQVWTVLSIAILLLGEVAFYGLIGAIIWLRRRELGFEPSRSPERTAARLEGERVKERARMVDDVFQNVRIGKHVDATAPLAHWLRDVEAEHAVRDALHVAEQTLKWKQPAALNPIGSTLIRHLLRFGRPDAALSVFELFRTHSSRFTMDSAHDLRTLAEYAESVGKGDLATSMRLETPVHHSM